MHQLMSESLWQLCAAMMSWVGCLLPDSELFIIFAENSQILLKISVIPILFHVSGSPESVSKQPTQLIVKLNSSMRHIIVTNFTLKSLIDKQTGINKQGWKKVPPCSFID